MQVQAIGMPWYTRDNWPRLMAMFEDRHKLHRTYDEWLRAAEAGCKAQEVKGVRVVRANIDPDDFAQWCKAKGLKLDANGRMAFANEAAYRAITGGL